MPDFRFPSRTQRIAVVGRTGSGKTTMAAWLLSHTRFDTRPYVIVDYKYDRLLNDIPRLEELRLSSKIPRHPGLYIVHPLPGEDEQVEEFLWRVWEKERVGVYIDEAHILPDKEAFRALLTQGRSKQIPMIVITQRPSWVCRFVFSEADYYSVFHLNDARDRKIVQQFTPFDMDQPLPEYHSWYYDVAKNAIFCLQPVPNADSILTRFDDRMPRTWFLRSSVARRRAA